MAGEEEIVVTARVLPENREVYETLVALSERSGMTREQVNTQLLNAGLFIWVERISRDLDKGPPDEDEGGEGGTKPGT